MPTETVNTWDDYRKNFPKLDAELPLALFPVRLETRFVATRGPVIDELWVRMYPEPIGVDAFQPALTADEQAAGKRYWGDVWKALGLRFPANRRRPADALRQTLTDETAAWETLVAAVGGRPRALGVLTQLRPTNLRVDAALPAAPDFPTRPTNPRVDVVLPAAPDFPTVPLRAVDEDPIPVARLLPERWVVHIPRVGADLHVVGREIPDDLACGPSLWLASTLKRDPRVQPPIALLRAAKAEWLVDFAAAIAVGMAVKVPIDTVTRKQAEGEGLSVRVWGVRSGDAAARVERAFASHHFTTGMAFVAPGTPTNTTEEDPAGWTPADGPEAVDAAPAAIDTRVPAESVLSGSGAGLVRALGLPATSVLSQLPGSGEGGSPDALGGAVAAALNEVLWTGTLRSVLVQMLSGTALHPHKREALRAWFTAWVRADGPLATLRLGRHPYGVIPVSLPRTVKDPQTTEEGVEAVAAELRRVVWNNLVEAVPRLDPDAQDSVTDAPADAALLARILRCHPDPQAFSRNEVDYGETWTARRYEVALDVVERVFADTYKGPLATFGKTDPLRVAVMAAADADSVSEQLEAYEKLPALMDSLRAGLKNQVAAVAHLHNQPAADYIRASYALVKEDWSPLRQRIAEIIKILQEFRMSVGWQELLPLVRSKIPLRLPHTARQQRKLLGRHNLITKKAEPLVGPAADVWLADLAAHLRGGPAPAVGDKPSIFRELVQAAVREAEKADDKTKLADALALLAGLPARELQRRVAATLGLVVHRLDAWITSVATARLAHLRSSTRGTGLLVGGFGWVDDLRPRGGQPNSQGYLLAPSLQHAATAALLRSGYSVHGELGGASPLAVDLSSRRLRAARDLFDGVRQGQSVRALLGERFERQLHELGLDYGIQPIRDAVAAAIKAKAQDEVLAPRRVVDGLVLARALDDREDARDSVEAEAARTVRPLIAGWKQTIQSDRPGLTEAAAWDLAVADLVDVFDAAADAGVAESMHALVAGNTTRLASTLEALDRGEAPPPELEFARTPRTGIRVHHRLILRVAPGTPAAPLAGLEAWLAALLPAGLTVRLDTADGPKARPLAALGLSWLDLVRLTPPTGDLAGTPLAEAIAALGLGSVGAAAQADLADLLVLMRPLQALLRASRPLMADDLVTPGGREPQPELEDIKQAAWRRLWDGEPGWTDPLAGELLAAGAPPDGFATNLGRSDARVGADPATSLRAWLAQAGKVRRATGDLAEAVGLAEAVAGGPRVEMRVAQLPDVAEEPWAGRSVPPESRLSLLCVASTGAVVTGGAVYGLLLDHWTEVVPGAQERCGVTLHWDAPGARGPQVIAIGVPPADGWTPANVEALVGELRAQARLRGVVPDFLGLAGLRPPSQPASYLLPAAHIFTEESQ